MKLPLWFPLQNNLVEDLQSIFVVFVVLFECIELHTRRPQQVLQFFHARIDGFNLRMGHDSAFFGN